MTSLCRVSAGAVFVFGGGRGGRNGWLLADVCCLVIVPLPGSLLQIFPLLECTCMYMLALCSESVEVGLQLRLQILSCSV